MITVCEMCEAVKEKEILEIIKEEKRREEKRKTREKIIVNTIYWCDTILSEFMAEKMATDPTMAPFNSDRKIMFVGEDGYCVLNDELEEKNMLVRPIVFSEPIENGFTLNNNVRYKRNYDIHNEMYDLDTIKTYCKNFGWDISLNNTWINTIWTYHHASDYKWYNYLTIKPIECEKNKY